MSRTPATGARGEAREKEAREKTATQEVNDRFVQEIAERIVGRENEPTGPSTRRCEKMKDPKSGPDERLINCATCHRGQTSPHDARP